MRPLSSDYDADPDRFLATDRHPHDDVHPYVAARFAAAGARTVLDVGGGHGRLARLLPGLGLRVLLVDLSPAMLDLAPRPAVRADGARLPVADASVDAVAALYTLYHYDDPLRPIRQARRVLRPGGLFAACAPNRDSAPELAHGHPRLGHRRHVRRRGRRGHRGLGVLRSRATRSRPTPGTAPWSRSGRRPMPPRSCGSTGWTRKRPRA